MIIFLCGPDDWRREQRKKFYIEEFKKKYSGLGIGYFDLAEEGALENLKAFLRAESLFQPKKLAILENLYEVDGGKLAEVLKLLVPRPLVVKNTTRSGKPNREIESTNGGGGSAKTVVLCSEKKKPSGALTFLWGNAAKAEEFEHLEGHEWTGFIKKEAEARLPRRSDSGAAEAGGATLSPDAVNFLAEIYVKNSWGLVTELEKLVNLGAAAAPRGPEEIVPKKGTIGDGAASGREISRADLEALGLETLPNYWMMVQSAKSQNLKTRLLALEKLLSQNEPPAKLFNILASLWRERIPQMAEYDFMIKSGKLEYEEALVELIL